MASSVFPAPSAAATEPAYVTAIPVALRTYQHTVALTAGIYDIDITPTSTNAQLVFVDSTSVLVNATTSSGVVRVTLSTPSTKFFVTTLAGATANASLKITKVAAPLTPGDVGNGTMDTVNTTGTYNQTGLLTVLALGGGAAGAKGINQYNSGPGGAPGAIVYGVVQNNAAVTITVGAKGTAATSNNTNITTPTNSSFGNLLTTTNSSFTAGAGGTTAGMYSAGIAGNVTSTFISFNGNSTTGGGGSGANGGSAAGGGAGSGIGTGGTGGSGGVNSVANSNPTTKGGAATGKAAGGGGGAASGNNFPNAVGRFGGDGSDGVVYVLRGF